MASMKVLILLSDLCIARASAVAIIFVVSIRVSFAIGQCLW